MGFMKQRKLLLQNAMQQDEDEFKKQSIFKYNYTLPADFPYKKTTTTPVGRVSDSLMESWTKRA